MPKATEIIYMDAVLTPNRSLSPRAFAMIMTGFGFISFCLGMAFLSLGALPVVGFFGLDALLLYFAFRWTFRRQSETTRVRVTQQSVTLEHRAANGRTKSATVPAAFARIELDEPLNANSWLRIEYGHTAYVIGRFLSLRERKSLAEALRKALINARSERHPA